MAVCVEAEAMAEARFATQLVLWNVCDEMDKTLVDQIALAQHLGQREASFPLRLPGIERVDTAVCRGISRRFFARDDARQMLQSFFLPRRHMRNDVSDRPRARDAGVHQLGLTQTGVRLPERPPGFVEPPQNVLSLIHTSSSRHPSPVTFGRARGPKAGHPRARFGIRPAIAAAGKSGACTPSLAPPSATFVAPQTPPAAARFSPLTQNVYTFVIQA
jgi:hypothetical protein